jgi:putative transposase
MDGSRRAACLWHALDRERAVLESNMPRTPDKAAALDFRKKAQRCHGSPEKIAINAVWSNCVAMSEQGGVDT